MISGGAGFIGSALCRLLKSQPDADITVIDSLSYVSQKWILDDLFKEGNCRLIQQDIRDKACLQSLIKDIQPDHIYHLAAETHVDRSINDPEGFLTTNITGTYNMVDAALSYWDPLKSGAKKEAFRFIHVSTDEVYGSLPNGEATEQYKYAPNSPYSASKASSDHLVRAWSQTYGLPVIMAHCCNNYGPYQNPEKLIPKVILRALKGQPLPVYGDGMNEREWLYVEDHAQALRIIGREGRIGERYNIGSGHRIRNIDLVKEICRILDRLVPQAKPYADLITFVEDRKGHDERYALNSQKIASELGWTAGTAFQDGLENTIAWYIAHQDKWRHDVDYY